MLLVFFLFKSSNLALEKFGFNFFISSEWDPSSETYGALPFIYGTAVTSILAILMALPVSISTAIFLTEVAPTQIRSTFRMLIELLAAIPSVVYGLWGIFVLAPFVKTWIQPFLKQHTAWMPLFQGPPMGIGILSASIALAIMIVPTITTITIEVFKAIPDLYREGAKALGATKWETIKLAVLKPGTAGIFAATILGLGRAIGETMAVTMLIGNRATIAKSLFSPGATLASVIANEYAEASSDLHLSALTAVGLALLLVSLVVNLFARLVVWKIKRGQ